MAACGAWGDRDPFIAIAAVVGAGFSIVIGLMVGLPFLRMRSRRLAAEQGSRDGE